MKQQVKIGCAVIAVHPRGGEKITGKVVKIDSRSAMAKAYGTQVTLDTGYTVTLADIIEFSTEVKQA